MAAFTAARTAGLFLCPRDRVEAAATAARPPPPHTRATRRRRRARSRRRWRAARPGNRPPAPAGTCASQGGRSAERRIADRNCAHAGSVRARANWPVWPAAAPLVGIGTSEGGGLDGLRMLRLGGGGGAAGAHRPEIGRAHV